MMYDSTGRAHKPAGSPASTGGQFAAEPAPALAAQIAQPRTPLNVAKDITRATRLGELADLCEGVTEDYPNARTLSYSLDTDEDGTYVSTVELQDAEGEVLGDADTENIREHLGNLIADGDDVADTIDFEYRSIDLTAAHRADAHEAWANIDLAPLERAIQDSKAALR